MKKNFIIHPFLLALYPVLFIFSVNADEVQFYQTITPSLSLIVFSFILFWLLRLLLNKNSFKAAFLTSFFFLTFFFFANLHKFITDYLFPSFQQRFLIVIYVAVYLILFFIVKRAKSNFKATVNPFNIIAIFLIIINAGNIILQKTKASKIKETVTVTEDYPSIGSSLSLGYKPDIYLFVLDEYAREDVIREVHGMDNSGFLNALKSRGFYVADSSHSNYPRTAQSVASLLSLNYLKGDANDDIQREVIQHNITFQLLKKMGYTTIAFPTDIEFTEFKKNVDRYISYPHVDNFSFHLICSTPLRPILLSRYVAAPRRRKSIIFPFDYLRQNKLTESPKFVYTHVPCPHEPYVFGPNGEVIDRPDIWGSITDIPELYRGQVVFINKTVLETIDTLFARSQHPPIMIIMGDHGSRVRANLSSAENNNLTEQFSNLCAINFPKGGDKGLYPAITPVNIFREMFNQYFGGNLKLLPDRSYFFTDEDTRFVDVTEEIKKEPRLEDLPPIVPHSYYMK